MSEPETKPENAPPAAPAASEPEFIPKPENVAPPAAPAPVKTEKRGPGRPGGKSLPKDRQGRPFDPALHMHVDGKPVLDSKGCCKAAPKVEIKQAKEEQKAKAAEQAPPAVGDMMNMKPDELAEVGAAICCVLIQTATGNEVIDSGRATVQKALRRYLAVSPVEVSPGMGLAMAVGAVTIPAVLSAKPDSPAGKLLSRFLPQAFGGTPAAPEADAPPPPSPTPAPAGNGQLSYGVGGY